MKNLSTFCNASSQFNLTIFIHSFEDKGNLAVFDKDCRNSTQVCTPHKHVRHTICWISNDNPANIFYNNYEKFYTYNYANVWTINQSKSLPSFWLVMSLDDINSRLIQMLLIERRKRVEVIVRNKKLIVIGSWMFAGEFYPVNREFPNLWCLMNTLFGSDVILISGPDTNIIIYYTGIDHIAMSNTKIASATNGTKLWLCPSVKQWQNPCSESPPVY